LEFGLPRGKGIGGLVLVNLPKVGVEVCRKFSGDWYGGLCVKEGHRYIGRYKLTVL